MFPLQRASIVVQHTITKIIHLIDLRIKTAASTATTNTVMIMQRIQNISIAATQSLCSLALLLLLQCHNFILLAMLTVRIDATKYENLTTFDALK